ncbi:Rib/alpha-like domain-containing protein, partial [Staphylococcus hominis]|uniref:Rib/alpha-like domain-containing protein n=1 Tax=Staphylococcus hominis TaxID=1290 RepID=UPI0039BF354B
PTITVDDPSTLPDGNTPGTVDVPVTVTYPDGTEDHVTVPVTTNEQARPTNKQTRQQFKIYNLDDYTPQLAQKHGLQYYSDSECNNKHLQEITKDVIDRTFLNERSL